MNCSSKCFQANVKEAQKARKTNKKSRFIAAKEIQKCSSKLGNPQKQQKLSSRQCAGKTFFVVQASRSEQVGHKSRSRIKAVKNRGSNANFQEDSIASSRCLLACSQLALDTCQLLTATLGHSSSIAHVSVILLQGQNIIVRSLLPVVHMLQLALLCGQRLDDVFPD